MDAERCPECQREPGEYKPWPVYTVRLQDGVERCARCLRALEPIERLGEARPIYNPTTSVIQPGLVVRWPTDAVRTLPPDWWRRTSNVTLTA